MLRSLTRREGSMRMRSHLRHLALLGLCFAIAGCGLSYRQAAGIFDAEPLLEDGWLEDGDAVSLTILRDGKPAAGHQLIVRTQPEPFVADISEQGVVEIPLRSAWLNENPWVEVRNSEGAVPLWRLKAQLSFSASLNSSICKTHVRTTFYDLGHLRARAVGPDVVYAEPNVPAEEIEKAARLLERERAALRDLFGKQPAAIGVVLLEADPERYRFNTDPKGRPVFGIRHSERNDVSKTVGTVVHEWTHKILENNFEIKNDPGARYLEDGLCEYIAHRTELAIRGTETTSTLAARAKHYAGRKDLQPGETLDLIALERANTLEKRPIGIAENLELLQKQMCEEPAKIGLGYEVGLAWWLSQEDADPQYLQKTLAALEEDPDLRAVLARTHPGVPINAIPHEAVLEIFERHGS